MEENCKIKSKSKTNFHFKFSSLATLQFKEVLKENKERKHLRGSGEIIKVKKKTERKWRANEVTGGSYTRT